MDRSLRILLIWVMEIQDLDVYLVGEGRERGREREREGDGRKRETEMKERGKCC